jgi:hypothetical protein
VQSNEGEAQPIGTGRIACSQKVHIVTKHGALLRRYFLTRVHNSHPLRLAQARRPLNDFPREKGKAMAATTYVLIMLFTVNYGTLGNPDSGKSGPTSVTVPGYASLKDCLSAKNALKSAIQDPDLKKRTLGFCIPGPTAPV